MAGALEGDTFIGRKAQEFRGLLKIKYPMEHGIVTDWNDMERIWSWIYAEELGTLSEEVKSLSARDALLMLTPYKSLLICAIAPSSPHRSTAKPTRKSRRCCANILRHVQCPCAVCLCSGRASTVRISPIKLPDY
jgi:hypothetical protein